MDKLRGRYSSTDPVVFENSLPTGWVPDIVVIDAMFLVNTKPLRSTGCISGYVKLLSSRFMLQHFQAGVQQIHLIFDKPGRQVFNSKSFEHLRCDENNTSTYIIFTRKYCTHAWQQNLECKQSIVEAIGLSFLQTGKFMLHPNQAIVLAGCFSGEGEDNAWVILPGDTSIPEPSP